MKSPVNANPLKPSNASAVPGWTLLRNSAVSFDTPGNIKACARASRLLLCFAWRMQHVPQHASSKEQGARPTSEQLFRHASTTSIVVSLSCRHHRSSHTLNTLGAIAAAAISTHYPLELLISSRQPHRPGAHATKLPTSRGSCAAATPVERTTNAISASSM